MKLLAAVGCFLSLSLAALATVTVPVADHSPAGCPFSYSGTVTLLEQVGLDNRFEGYTGDLVVRNNSSKAVVAVVATVLVHYSNGLNVNSTDTEEYFWKPDLPGQELPMEVNPLPKGVQLTEHPVSGRTAESLGRRPQPPSVEVITEWVQFADGTTWGDRQNPQVQVTLDRRRRDVDTMRRLANVYDTQGPEAFAHEVEQLPQAQAGGFAYHLKDLLQKQGGNPQMVIEKLREHLQVADARAALLN